MTTTERRERWCGAADPPAFARWVADRSAGCGRHLAPVLRVGRCPQGHLAAEVLRPSVHGLHETLDVVGVPTEGLAVTLTVPLLQVAASARAGAVELGAVPDDGVGVDDSGAVLVADHPDGAVPACADALGRVPTVDGPGGEPARSTAPFDPDGSRQLVLAARAVWDRVDPRAPARACIDPALDAARDGDTALVLEALALVRAAAPPRPVRWTRPASVLFDDGPDVLPSHADRRGDGPGDGAGAALGLVVGVVRDVVERGVPLGSAGRVPLRHVLVGGVVACGLVAAGISVL